MKRFHSFLSLVLFTLFPLGLHAAIEKDLGQALAFFRVTAAQADLSSLVDTIQRRPALVLDLRGVNCEAEFVTAFHSALAKAPAPHAARMILVNAATSKSLLAALDDDALISVIVLAPHYAQIDADIQISTTAEEERRALEALTKDTPVEQLIKDPKEKRRYDEAKLVHDHANGVIPADSELPADADDDTVTSEATNGKKPASTEKKAESSPRDLVLERAVQLHRALLALKKL